MNKKKTLLRFLLVSAIILLVAVFTADIIISGAAKGKLYNDIETVPYNKVGLLLGTPKFSPTGEENVFYRQRINAAVNLIRHHKIKYIIVSGNPDTVVYNEPRCMHDDLVKEGIDPAIIFTDSGSVRTFDSVIRLKDIFGQDSATIISQAFHNERALYIAAKKNITAIGFNAGNLEGSAWLKNFIREKFARLKGLTELWLGKKLTANGPKVSIPG